MPNLNVITLCGHLTRDVETKTLANGTTVANGGIAVNNRRKVNEQWTDVPVFIDFAVFGKPAEWIGRDGKKGVAVLLSGRLDMDSWQDKTTGQNRTKLKVIADTCYALPKSGSRSDVKDLAAGGSGDVGVNDGPVNEDIPF